MKPLSIYWCRRDLRIADNPALSAAVNSAKKNSGLFFPVFILEDYMTDGGTKHQFGYPGRVFLSKALPAFAEKFEHFPIFRGKGAKTIARIAKELASDFDVTVFANEDVHPDFYKQADRLASKGLKIEILPDQLTVPKDATSGTGNPYSVFTPFKKAVWKSFMAAPTAKKPALSDVSFLPERRLSEIPGRVTSAERDLAKQCSAKRTIEVGGHRIDLEGIVDAPDISEEWYFSEEEALKKFKAFAKNGLDKYRDRRDSLEDDANGTGSTSRMSLALAWGLVSARTLRDIIQNEHSASLATALEREVRPSEEGAVTYLSELIWREFYKYLLHGRPELLGQEFQERFRGTIAWVPDKEAIPRFKAWIAGETGYDIVDAAMKQLAKTGWMHNRARMIAASVLTKNLGVDWRWGQEYFRAQLVDLDDASNNGGWQWGASVGADPKPIRIFNPELQAETHDASGAYRKKWLGEERYFFKTVRPIVDHAEARAEALKRYGLDRHAKARDF